MASILSQLQKGSIEVEHNGRTFSVNLASHLQDITTDDLKTLDSMTAFMGASTVLRYAHDGLRHHVISQRGMARTKDKDGNSTDPDLIKVQKKIDESVPSLLTESKTNKQAEAAAGAAQEMLATGLDAATIEKVLVAGKYSQTAITYALSVIE